MSYDNQAPAQFRLKRPYVGEHLDILTGRHIDSLALEAFISMVQGKVTLPGDLAYEEERSVWNRAFDGYPAMIVHCLNVEDIKAAVTFAREQGLPLSVRSAGHSIGGYGTNDYGLVLDLASMKGLTFDPILRIARLEPGLTWGEVANALQPYGLALTSGDTSTVGVSGLLLGGGFGWMVRKYGLTIDHVRAIELVTADGQFLRASAEEHAELFWGLRGGGGNFGVVTAFEVALHPGGTILGGMVVFEATEAERILSEHARIASEAPDELSTEALFMLAPSAPFIPADKQGKPVVMIIVCYTGDIHEGERVVAPLRQIATPIADLIAPMPYADIFQFNRAGEAGGRQHHVATLFVEKNTQEFVHTLAEVAQEVMVPQTMILLRILGGAMNRVDKDATAFAHRDKEGLVMVTHYAPPAHDPNDLAMRTDRVFDAIAVYASGAYVGFQPDKGEPGIHEVNPPATYARLLALKHQYDPTNLFHLNQNIVPKRQQEA